MIIAGEISGDMHAAKLVADVKQHLPDTEFWGIGGECMREEGVDTLVDIREMAVLGITEVLKRYGFFKRVFRDMIDHVEARKPDAVILVDYPGFNLRFARQMHKRGVKVIYYICPQVWAWKRGRIAQMAEWLDRLLVIFPFEVDVFKGTGLETNYVGHPLVEEAKTALAAPRSELPWPANSHIALLPGSRMQEVERILPVMLATLEHIRNERPDVGALIAASSQEAAARIEALTEGVEGVQCVIGQTREILIQADAALVASGTATLETALLGCPMLVIYRTAALTYAIGKRVVKIPYIGMVNIIAGREICPEFIQEAARAERIAPALITLLEDEIVRAEMKDGLKNVFATLADAGERSGGSLIAEDLRSSGQV
ncbi:MAG: lipid-A-disaccharide synthase [Candidatus Omnitrophota bacterium]|jgi:lipid-A-disaccharide synthase